MDNISSSAIGFVRVPRTVALALRYASIISASFYLSYELRFAFVVPDAFQSERLRLLPLVVGVEVVFLVVARQMGTMLTYFSVPDLVR